MPRRNKKSDIPPDPPQTNAKLHRIIMATLLLILAVAGWRSINYVSGRRPSTDSGAFTACALHMVNGKVLYKDAWDHKPPMIHLLNSMAFRLGDVGIDSVRNMERIFAAAGLVCLFFILHIMFKNKFIAFFMSILFSVVFYIHTIFHEGNLTEEYGSIFVLFGILFVLLSQTSGGTKTFVFAAAAGCFFCFAFLTKEPFLLSALPWFAYLFINKEISWRQRLKRSGFFVAGAIVPFTGIVLYLAFNGALRDWVEVISFNLFYSGVGQESTPLLARVSGNMPYMHKYVFSTSVTAMFCFIAGIVSCFCLPFQKKYKFFPLIAVTASLADYMATIISDRNFDHYYMQPVVSFILVGGCGLGLLYYFFKKSESFMPGVIISVLLCFFLIDAMALKYYKNHLKRPALKTEIGPLSKYIKEHSAEDDFIWITSEKFSKYYLETGRLSPTRYIYPRPFFFRDSLYSTAEEKISVLKHDLHERPPKFIIATSSLGEFMKRQGIAAWITDNYVAVGSVSPPGGKASQKTVLYMNKSFAPQKK